MSTTYLNIAKEPRGFRNNNPGNLVKTSIPWSGKINNGKDTRFEQFKTFEHGLRACMLDVFNDITRKKQDTVKKLISSYAPSFENNTRLYIDVVAKTVDIHPDDIIPLDKASFRRLVKAIVLHENGKIFSEEQFEKAFSMLPLRTKSFILSKKKRTKFLPIAGAIIFSALAMFGL